MKKIFALVAIFLMFSIIPQSFAQQLNFGPPATQTVEITIDEEGNAHVMHNVVATGKETQQVYLITNSYSNLKIYDQEGKEPQNALSRTENFSVVIFPTKLDVRIEYDIENAVELKNGVWFWHISYPASTSIIVPEKVDLAFANDRPVKLDEARGIKCHGCDVRLEYIFEEPIYKKEVQWEDKNFIVGVRSVTEITSFEFDQPRKTILFDVNEPNQFVTLFIPLELLWNPYDVYLNDANILKHEFFNNGTHLWLNIRPETTGTVLIIGTSAVPEFSIMLPLFLGIAGVILFQYKSRLSLH